MYFLGAEVPVRSSGSASSHFVKSLLDAIPGGALAVDSFGCIVGVNDRLVSTFGYSREDLVNQSFDILLPVRFRRRCAKLFEGFAANPCQRQMGTSREWPALHKRGTEFPVDIGLNHFRTAHRSLFLAIVIDLSERKRAEEAELVLRGGQFSIDLCEQLGLSAALVGLDAQVVRLNGSLEKVRPHFLVRDDRIEFSNQTVQRQFVRELERFRHSTDGARDLTSTFTVPAAGAKPPAIVRLTVVIGNPSARFRASPLVLVVARAVGVPKPSSIASLRDIFGLTAAEAKIAAFVGSGMRVGEVASHLSLSKETVRTELAHSFFKMGISSQAQLAAMVASLFGS
jgi:PAS domain S-box-containing protein